MTEGEREWLGGGSERAILGRQAVDKAGRFASLASALGARTQQSSSKVCEVSEGMPDAVAATVKYLL